MVKNVKPLTRYGLRVLDFLVMPGGGFEPPTRGFSDLILIVMRDKIKIP